MNVWDGIVLEVMLYGVGGGLVVCAIMWAIFKLFKMFYDKT